MADDSPCLAEDCDRPVGRHGAQSYCGKHYQRWRKYGSVELAPRAPRSAETCSAEGCDRQVGEHGARGLCAKHYMRWKATGSTGLVPRVVVPCSVEECDRESQARGWCHKHYEHWRQYGDPLRKPVVERQCSVEGCGRPHDSHGWCQGHKVRWLKSGDVQADIPIRDRTIARTCSLADCHEPHFARDLCRLHYARLQKTGTTDGPPQYGDVCSVEDCDRPSWVKGLCQRCYMRIKGQQWRADHPGYDAEAHSAWRAANIEESRRRARQYAKSHPETKRAAEARRQERKRRTEAERIDYEKVLAEHGMVCHICWWDITSRADLHFDHVIPLARGGTHTYDNIKPAHSGCNRWKHARLMSEL